MGDITAANASLVFTIPGVLVAPEQIQGFAADDVYDLDEIESAEAVMGVDGILSTAFVWKPQMQRITLQADSPSNDVFDAWDAQNKALIRALPCSGVLSLPSIRRKFVQTNGYLTRYKLPGAKKSLTPRTYGITWNLVVPSPL